MNIPTLHLSVRVPWHDNQWNGKICNNPRENGSCMFLPRINQNKNVETEESNNGEWFHEIDDKKKLPPCIGEKVHFMSPHDIYKSINHPYSSNLSNEKFYGHYRETTLKYPGFSFSVIPYNWMLKNPKNNESSKANELQIPYDPELEPKLSFENTWVQQIDNQKAILDTFVKPIKVNSSLVFIYAKNIPYIEGTSRILIGVGHISRIGKLTEYEYEESLPNSFRSTLWERPVYHTIREGFENGFLLPYHDFFKIAEKDNSINIQDYIAYAPSFEEFSYGSEWVSNDTAIESLLIMHEKLQKLQEILPEKNFQIQLDWIDNEISRIWKLRGPFPSLGAILSGIKVKQGNLIAWEIDKIVRNEESNEVIETPWNYVEKLFQGDRLFLPRDVDIVISETHRLTWQNLSLVEKSFLELLSRMNLDNTQVSSVLDSKEFRQRQFLENPYLLYELSRLEEIVIPISTIDKAIFSEKQILKRFPLPTLINIEGELDKRRVRAIGIEILERNALNGHTLLTDNQLVTSFDAYPLQPLCNPSIRNLMAVEDFLKEEIVRHSLDPEKDTYYYKLTRLEHIKKRIKSFVQKRLKRSINPEVKCDWLDVLENEFEAVDESKPSWYKERDFNARKEKAYALDVISNNRVSVLIGPAGTGKTTLLQVFWKQGFIQTGSVLKLAPTGKARVKLGNDAYTLGQFLYKNQRYNPATGVYYTNPDVPQVQYDTVIIDEASMITEEQLAALIDSLTGVQRFILVGDFRQLPPIGSGRPFADIIKYLRTKKKGIAELKILFRQFEMENIPKEEPNRLDVRLSRWFSEDEIKKDEADIFEEIAENKIKDWENIRFVQWHNIKHLNKIIPETLDEEISRLLAKNDLNEENSQNNFDISLGGKRFYNGNDWIGFGFGSANEIENWQVLSPTRTAGYGTKVLNQLIQKKYRSKTKEKAIFPGKGVKKNGEEYYYARKMPKPIGDDGIVYGDKLINAKNTRRNHPSNRVYNPNHHPENDILKYIANGEIGIHIGKYGKWEYDSPRPINILFSTQPDYAYIFNPSEFKEDGDIQMELAYSITVHKSQGSGFGVVFFILPNPCPLLTRELFYTALTRQKDRIVILHQGEFKDFRKYHSGEFSETGRRLTDLLSEPSLKLINKKFYDTKYIQVSAKGEFMISKSEVIIADMLYLKQIPYAYEASIADEKGVVIHPDFTIEDSDTGITYYWEHLGLLIKDDYRSKWKRKQEWYKRNNILPYQENEDADKQLIITRDKPDGGIDSSEIKEIIEELFD